MTMGVIVGWKVINLFHFRRCLLNPDQTISRDQRNDPMTVANLNRSTQLSHDTLLLSLRGWRL